MPESANPALDNQEFALTEAENLLFGLANLSFPIDLARKKFLTRFGEELAGAKAVPRPDAGAKYRALVEQIPAVIFMAFLDEGVSEAYVSPHIETVLGFTQEEWLRDPVRWYKQIHPDDRGRWNIEAAQLVVSGQPLRSVYRIIARDGHLVWFHCEVKLVLTDDGRPWFVHCTAFDISELKQAEERLKEAQNELEGRVQQRTAELERANASLRSEIAERMRAESELANKAEELTRSNADLEQFAYSASHDLQEPLRNIAIYSQWLKGRYRGKLDAKADEFITFIDEGAQRMTMMVRDLLSYTQTANCTEPAHEVVDANQALAESMENLQALIRDNRATIAHDRLPRVKISEIHLQQLFQNLISNGIKYRSEEVPCIHVSSSSTSDECRFSVKDNGIGIAPEHHEKIFGIFKRLHSNDKYDGTGIGLAICKRIVERCGGRIWVESEPNRGSTFFFTLPLADARGSVSGLDPWLRGTVDRLDG